MTTHELAKKLLEYPDNTEVQVSVGKAVNSAIISCCNTMEDCPYSEEWVSNEEPEWWGIKRLYQPLEDSKDSKQVLIILGEYIKQ